MIFEPNIAEKQLWFLRRGWCFFYNVVCLVFVLAAWYPATHMVRILIADENFAQTWYIFWILPLIFIGTESVYSSEISEYFIHIYGILQIYIVVSLVLLIILTFFMRCFL